MQQALNVGSITK